METRNDLRNGATMTTTTPSTSAPSRWRPADVALLILGVLLVGIAVGIASPYSGSPAASLVLFVGGLAVTVGALIRRRPAR